MINMILARFVCAALIAGTSVASSAAVFSGSDDGAATTGPFTNSSAAQASFLSAAAAYGTVLTNGFESAPLGYTTSLAITGATITTASPDFGAGFSGVTNQTVGNLYGFNTTSGGANWYGFPDTSGVASATVTFNTPTNSFGFWLTGVQTTFTSSISLTQLDGSSQTFALPVNVNGGTNFFGITDATAFTGVTISITGGGDAFGIDDLSFNAAVPEPTTWAMLIGGLGLTGLAMRRRRVVAA